ncbi:phosphatidylinositol-4-phosphate 5-kinase [Musa troglodytarum]|uniref:1-phosphatidylinositol-4-phosphate 5-kinase n=1 Tax=Musa troglodytarum TaxID=320322 RepID=A0A9E7JQ65_9LILI|nr:phosphatidylinositol-4-phosphate 5-kinase [Musa troglodytarum]
MSCSPHPSLTPTPRLLPLLPLAIPDDAAATEQEPSYLDFTSTSTLLLWCSIDSKGTHTEFEWTDYSAAVFRNLQEFDEINFDDYSDSMRRRETLRLLFSNKKNVTSLHLPHDDRFILKIISKSQMKVFLEMLPKYYQHVKTYTNTLLANFYGLHVVKPRGGQKVRFIVTRNILQSDSRIHKHFVIRGLPHSYHVNKAGDEEDLNLTFHLHTPHRNKILMQLKHDCNFLEEAGITHYSLLLGMHICSTPFEAALQVRHSPRYSTGSADCNESSDGPESENGDADQDLSSDDDTTSSWSTETEDRLGVKMAARAVGFRKRESNVVSTHMAGTVQPNNVNLFFGITDILHHYSVRKHIEHVLKSLQTDHPSVSGVNPKGYSTHFQECVSKIFSENDFDINMP